MLGVSKVFLLILILLGVIVHAGPIADAVPALNAMAVPAKKDQPKSPKALSKPKPNGVLNGLKVSRMGRGQTYLRLSVYLSYYDFKTDEGRPTYFSRKRIQINDTDLLNLLPFNRKDKSKVTYDDLRYEVINKTSIADLFNTLVDDELQKTMDEEGVNMRQIVNSNGVATSAPDNMGQGDNDGGKTVMYRPSRVHWKNKDVLLSAVLPGYILITVLLLIGYIARAKFGLGGSKSLFKLSNVSRLLLKFLFIRLIFDAIYLVYLVLFIHFNFFYTNGFLYFCFLSADEIINLVAFYFTVSLFCQGYLTITQTKAPLHKPITILLTLLYGISVTLVEIYYKNKFNNSTISASKAAIAVNNMAVNSESFIAPVIVLFKMLYFGLGTYFTYLTLQANPNLDPRFKRSGILILVTYYCSSLITLPIFRSFEELEFFIRLKFLSVVPSIYIARAEVPQLLQLAMVAWLIYYWRDRLYDKVLTVEDGYELN